MWAQVTERADPGLGLSQVVATFYLGLELKV